MEVASEMTAYKHESSMEITDNTRANVGVAVAFCYEAMYDEKRRNSVFDKIETFVNEQLLNPSLESKVRVTAAITALLQHAPDVGQALVN